MTIKQTTRGFMATIAVALFVGLTAAPVFLTSSTAMAASCGGVDTAILNCGGSKDAKDVTGTGIWSLLKIAIQILTGGVGVAALGGVIYGAVIYTSAGGSPEKVKHAKEIFINVAIGVIAFASMFTLLNFLIPGGVFS